MSESGTRSARMRWARPALAGIMAALKWIGCYCILAIALDTIVTLIHPFNHIKHDLSFFSKAMRENSPLPEALGWAIISFFIIDAVLAAWAKASRREREWFGTSRFFLVGASLVLAGLWMFWHMDGPYTKTTAPVLDPVFLAGTRWLLAAGLILGVIAGLIARYRARLRWLTFVPPGLVLVIGIYLAQVVPPIYRIPFNSLPELWPTLWRAAVALVLLAGVSASFAYFERLAFGEARRSLELGLVGLWLYAAGTQWFLVNFYHDCLCRTWGPSPEGDIAVAVLWCVWLVAVIVRLIVHLWQRRRPSLLL